MLSTFITWNSPVGKKMSLITALFIQFMSAWSCRYLHYSMDYNTMTQRFRIFKQSNNTLFLFFVHRFSFLPRLFVSVHCNMSVYILLLLFLFIFLLSLSMIPSFKILSVTWCHFIKNLLSLLSSPPPMLSFLPFSALISIYFMCSH